MLDGFRQKQTENSEPVFFKVFKLFPEEFR